MLSHSRPETNLDRLTDTLRQATSASTDLFYDFVTAACTRLPAMRRAGKAADFDRLVETGAWCDAALALMALEAPGWCIRRLINEDGEWFCSLSREPNLPAALDDTADANHQVLPLAILSAFLEARRRSLAAQAAGQSAVPAIRPAYAGAICCDNFS